MTIGAAHPEPPSHRIPRITAAAALLISLIPASRAASALCDGSSRGIAAPASPAALGAAEPTLPRRAPAPRPEHPAPGAARIAVLTFDAAWETGGAGAILDALASRGVHATFFVAGRFARAHPDLVRRIAQGGHEIGNHTYRHDHLTRLGEGGARLTRPGLSEGEFLHEMEEAREETERAAGRPISRIWRAPYGEIDDELRAWGREAGYAHVGWSEGLDTLDWVADTGSSLYHPAAAEAALILRRLSAREALEEGPLP